MAIRLIEFSDTDIDFLVQLLCAEEWPYHSGTTLDAELVRSRIASGFYTQPGTKTFIVCTDRGERIGSIRLFDLGNEKDDSETPLFDIRLTSAQRSKGYGTAAVRALVDYVFTTYPNKNRFEATTRYDNAAMRRVLQHCGFAKEAHYRQAWPDKSGTMVDCVGYGILRADWESGTATPVRWQQ